MIVWLPLALLFVIFVVWLLRRQELLVVAVALIAFYGIGFLAPFLDQSLRLALVLLGSCLLLAVVAIVARVASTKWAAATAAFILVPLSFIALGYGIYEAHETGWHGLRQLGASSDAPGIGSFWLVFIYGTPLWIAVGVVSGTAAFLICSPDADQKA